MRLAQLQSVPRHRGTGLTRLIAIVPLSILLASCGGGGGGGGGGSTPPPPPPPVTYTANSGVAQKGPLIKGSTVTAQELDANLSPTGKQYSYQITSDLGTFSPTSTFGSAYIGLNATGYYFDEVLNAVSTAPITLNGYSDLATNTVLNVNLLTTLAYQRIQNLVVNSKMTFVAARTQAEGEVLTALNIPTGSYGSFGSLDLGGGTDGDHILAAISSLFIYGNSAGQLSQLIANFQSDIGTNGKLTVAATSSALVSAAKAVNAAAVAANLTQKYSSVGATFAATDISNWIDQDGDGVVGKFKFQVPDATPSSVFTFPTFVVSQVAGANVSVIGGKLSINGTPVTGAFIVQAGDVVAVSPGAGAFPNGVLTVYIMSGNIKTARVSFVSGLLSIAVMPASPSVPKGLTQQLTAVGTFSDNSTGNVTSNVSWTSGTPTIATVNATSGLVTTLALGSTVITATSGAVSASTTLTVTPVALETISIAPNPVTIGVGINQPLTAAGTYSDGSTQNVTSAASWTSSTPAVATIVPTTGLTTGVSTGSATISATVGSVSGTAPLSVITNAWVSTGNMIAAREYHTETLLPNGAVLVAGGCVIPNGNTVQLASAELYAPATGIWTATGNLTIARQGHTATVLPNGTVLVAGGWGSAGGINQGPFASAEIYNPATGTWTATGSMTMARYYHTATLLPNGTVLVAAGSSGGASAEIYDPATGTWTATGSLSTPRQGHTATLLPNGTVLVAGGVSGGSVNSVLASAEIYDPVARTWTVTGSLATARTSHTATLLQNGKVLAVGGLGISGTTVLYLASAEIFDPATGAWTMTGSLTTARASHTSAMLMSGKVLVAGGYDTAVLASAEIYDPAAGTWATTGSLTTARWAHSAVSLPNGTVLAAGGTGLLSSSSSLASAEIYDDLL